MAKKLRAFLTGLFHETNTYVPPGDLSGFPRTAGQDLIDQNRHGNTPHVAYIDFCEKNNIEVVGGVQYLGNPSGQVSNQDYQTMKADIMDAAKKAGEIDLLMLWFHGAACVEGLTDPEVDIVRGLKKILGNDVKVLSLGMDLHGKCSDEFAEICDLVSCVHKYPHIDYFERAQHCLQHVPGILDGSIKPTRHVAFLPLIYPVATTMGDGIGPKILANLKKALVKPGILDICYMHGFPYADHEFTGGYVIATTNNDMALAKKEAKAFANWVWRQREPLNKLPMTIEDAIQATLHELHKDEAYKPRPKVDLDKLATDIATQDAAIEEAKGIAWGFVPDWDHKPIIIADAGDNPGGGTAACSTHLLRRLMEENIERTVFLGLCDPEVAKKAHKAGVGAVIDVELGGGSKLLGESIKAKAYVKTLADGRTMNRFVLAGLRYSVGLVARIMIGPMEIIVNSVPWQGFDNAQALIGGVDVNDYKVVALKSSAHFRAYFTRISDKIFLADGPGGTSGILNTFHPKHLRGSIYPFDLKTQYPA